MTRTTEAGPKHAAGRRQSAADPADASPARRIAGSARRIEALGLLIGLLAGLGATLAYFGFRGSAPAPSPAAASTNPPVVVRGSASGAPDPAALDKEWLDYSNRSTCADWAGGDGVSAYRLNSSQLAWFFSDTYLGPAGPTTGFSRISGFVHNSVVVQTSASQGSTFVTMTGGGACAGPGQPSGPVTSSVVGAPMAPGSTDDRYWDADGIEIGGTIIKFYNRFLPGTVPFIPTGTVIATFPASQLSSAGHGSAYGAVARPDVIPLPSYTPAGGSPVLWGAALLRAGNTIYVYGTETSNTSGADRLLYLARVSASKLTQFSAWQFYAGEGEWAGGQQDAQPVQPPASPLGVSSGFSVVAAGQRYWLIQADPVVGSQDIDAYPAATPWGPFDPAGQIVLYHSTGIGLDPAHDYRIMYEARAEPALSTGHNLVISYNVNSEAVTTGCVPMSAYTNTVTQPRFISVPIAAFEQGANLSAFHVTDGPSDYPSIVPRDPSQWFDAWTYSSGCPPVPGMTNVSARARPGGVTLTWPDAGLGIRYQVYLFKPQADGFTPVTTAYSDSATITGLRSGVYLARVVPANFKQTTGQGLQVSFTVP
ncbi:MAG: hypothetical protein JO345_28785 [Streptosporangiaceae bacterium]|nr:hypothetical protein [Streptosporangiaceae bacterium]